MKRIIISSLICCFLVVNTFAQVNGAPITIGTNYTINSKILNQDREIQIYLPDSYTSSEQNYPVLYILDGQRFFTNGVSIQKTSKAPLDIPEMIVVGINSNWELRRTLFGDGEKFTSFIKNEVIQFVDSNYRTTNERLIFGWEAAAYYISEMILKERDLFSGAIITDGGFASEETVKGFNSDEDIYLYMANSRKDIYYVSSSDDFSNILEKSNPKNLRWKYELFNDEFHQTLPNISMYKGIKYYYHNFPSLIFESIPAYIDAGEIPYLESYFKERAKRFGGDGKIDNATKDRLIWLAENHGNFKYFSFFMEEFKDVLSTERYASAYWQNRFAQFYLKYKDYKNAFKYFNTGLTVYPNSNLEAEMKQGLNKAKKMTN